MTLRANILRFKNLYFKYFNTWLLKRCSFKLYVIMEIIKSIRGGSKLCNNGYCYTKKKTTKNNGTMGMFKSSSSENKGADQLAVTGKLICVFVFAYADCLFSHDKAHLYMYVLNIILIVYIKSLAGFNR